MPLRRRYGYDGILLRCLQVTCGHWRLNPISKLVKHPRLSCPQWKLEDETLPCLHGDGLLVLPAVFLFVVLQKSQAFLT